MEIFSPPSIRERPSDHKDVLDLQENQVPPWHPQHPNQTDERLRPPAGFTWQHTVFGGVFELERMRDAVVDVFGDDPQYRDERLSGCTALFALTVNAEGKLIKDSEVLSACAWAVGRTVGPGPGDPKWLDDVDWALARVGFGSAVRSMSDPVIPTLGQAKAKDLVDRAREAAAEAAASGLSAIVGPLTTSFAGPLIGAAAGKATETFAKKLISPDDSAPEGSKERDDASGGDPADNKQSTAKVTDRRRPLTTPDLFELRKAQAYLLGVEKALDPGAIWVASRRVRVKANENADNGFLNSFILDDLTRAANALDISRASAPLTAYLRPREAIDVHERIDVRQQPGAVLAATEPRHVPGGRWVTKAGHPLVLSQQFAVNRIFDAQTADRVPVFAVNGPPGTGKTTMLRDVIAGLVVQRAERLAALPRPEAAFIGSHSWSTENWRKTVRQLRPELVGFEMVVACANNGAAKNITREFPGPKGIDASWRATAKDVDYFAGAASIALGLEQSPPDGQAWAAIAGALGAMKYRKAFTQRVWWGVTEQEENAAAREEREAVRSQAGLADILSAQNNGGEPVNWPAAVARFSAAKAAVEALTTLRQAAADAGRRVTELALDIRTLADSADHLRERIQATDAARAQADAALAEAENARELTRRARSEHSDYKPGLWVSLSTRGRAGREWHERDQTLAAAMAAADAAGAVVRRAVQDAANRSDSLRRQLADVTGRHSEATKRLQRAEQEWSKAVAAWPGHVPTADTITQDAAREMLAPWGDAEIAEARTRLFLEALRLHKSFLLANARTMRQNLYAAFDVISGAVPENADGEAIKAAWQSLFLAIPVVSTTFASAGRLFSHLGPGDLGWAFIDEAGQAAPQNACGVLLRARRAVVVGDPLQLEPVVTIPHTVQQALRNHFGVAEEWLPGWTSVQALADRPAPHGTWLDVPSPDGTTDRTWVGAPLRVHRRCDDPTFTISNTIAYGGTLMVNGKHPVQPADDPYLALPASRWDHVEAPDAEGTWIPAEGRTVRRIVEALLARNVDPAEIKVISPFRDVVEGCQGLGLDLPGEDAVGTIHTMQGKEADIVLLVLGSDPRKPGQRGWAAAKPNLLNVAASRAKRRLYVIGNRDLWKNERYFVELTRHLNDI
ncbi:DEAD/DEAH box helicase [Catenulispora rubra]|uniref:DEAD/DEAH box helicase n=1 Tax=Catenulispora rubra TaxID=280293 RepID=UPI001892102B|nr:ATP-binding protein [Catenulispora rubra]